MTDNDFRNHTVNALLIGLAGYGTYLAYRELYPTRRKGRAYRTTKLLKRRRSKKKASQQQRRISTVRMFHTHTPRRRFMYKADDWVKAQNKLKIRSKKKRK